MSTMTMATMKILARMKMPMRLRRTWQVSGSDSHVLSNMPLTCSSGPASLHTVHPTRLASCKTITTSSLATCSSRINGVADVGDSDIIRRWKHAARMGKFRETLEDLAHGPEREAAKERRQKKKDRKLAKKQKKHKGKGAIESAEDVDDLASDWEDDESFGDEEDMAEETDAEPSLPDPSEMKEKMMDTAKRFEESLKAIRGAEPTPEIFEDIQVNAYGSAMTPLKAVAQVVIASPTLAQISCFDPSVAKQVKKAIQMNLQTMNPQIEEAGMIKVPIPKVSMETRKETAKQLQQRAEACKRRVRGIRRKAMEMVKKGKDGKLEGVSKDDAFATAKELDEVTDSVMKTIEVMVDRKMESIMAV